MSPKVWLAAAVLLFLRPLPPPPVEWQPEHPRLARRLAVLPDTLHESSGVAASRAAPGIFWTFNDSGNEPLIFGVDSAGRVLHVVRPAGWGNDDWEAISLGRCGRETCLYIGDIGDNSRGRPAVRLIRIRERDALAAGGLNDAAPAVPAEAVEVRYPDGAKDAESLLVLPNGDALIIAKPVRVPAVPYYLVPAAAWSRRGLVTARGQGQLPIDPRAGPTGWVTDAALAPDSARVVVRTYRALFFFRLTPDHRLIPGSPPRRCDIGGLEPQGEGVTWADDSTLVLTTERFLTAPATIDLVRCPGSIDRSP